MQENLAQGHLEQEWAALGHLELENFGQGLLARGPLGWEFLGQGGSVQADLERASSAQVSQEQVGLVRAHLVQAEFALVDLVQEGSVLERLGQECLALMDSDQEHPVTEKFVPDSGLVSFVSMGSPRVHLRQVDFVLDSVGQGDLEQEPQDSEAQDFEQALDSGSVLGLVLVVGFGRVQGIL